MVVRRHWRARKVEGDLHRSAFSRLFVTREILFGTPETLFSTPEILFNVPTALRDSKDCRHGDFIPSAKRGYGRATAYVNWATITIARYLVRHSRAFIRHSRLYSTFRRHYTTFPTPTRIRRSLHCQGKRCNFVPSANRLRRSNRDLHQSRLFVN